MTKNNRYALPYRRRRSQKTNYLKRLNMLKSRKIRLVVRKSNMHTLVQCVQYFPDGDKVLLSASTKDLSSYEWNYSTSSIPAAYVAGLLLGKKALDAGLADLIVDLGMQVPHKQGRLFAAVFGVQEAGVSVSVSDEALPPSERVNGSHINEAIAKSIAIIKKKAGI